MIVLTYSIPRQGEIYYLEVDKLGQVRLSDEQLVDEWTNDAVNLTQVVKQAFFTLSNKSLMWFLHRLHHSSDLEMTPKLHKPYTHLI